MSNQSAILSLLAGVEFDDPRLFSMLDLLIRDFYTLSNQINPPSASTIAGVTGQVSTPDAVSGFTYTVYGNNVKLSWGVLDGLRTFEIRYMFGQKTAVDWEDAAFLIRTSTFSADINPVTIPLTIGFHTFFIKTIDTFGVETATAEIAILNVPQITAPIISPVVINNFVLLYWTVPQSLFDIAYYNLYKNGVLQGKVNGNFKTIFETVGGTYSYVVEAVDIVGNVGAPSPESVVVVTNPYDFSLHATLTDDFSGTYTDTKLEVVNGENRILASIDTTKSYEDHFIDNSWASPQEQIDAGYPLYIQPSETTGSYQTVFDFGTIVANIIVVVTWNTVPIVGAIDTGTSTIETSTDGSTWGAPVVSSSTFAQSVRYVRFTFNFVSTDDLSLAYFYNLQCSLNVRYEQDGGIINAVSTDVGGTTVTFTKAYKSVVSITLTPVSTVERKAIYDFAFPVNPTTFKVLLFNAAGARVTGDVTWIARGIL